MKTICIVLSLTLLSSITGCTTTGHVQDTYTLSVWFHSRYNSDFTISTPVSIDKCLFSTSKQNGEIRNSIEGALLPPNKGKYPLVLTIAEWESEESNSRLRVYKEVKLDEPISFGAISSIVSTYTITLSEEINNNAEQAGPAYPPQGVGSADP